MDATEQTDKEIEDKSGEKPASKGGEMMMRALGVFVLIAAMGGAAFAGAVLAVGQERLYEHALALFEKSETDAGPESPGQAYVPLPETIYTLSGRGAEQYLMATITLRTDQRNEATVRERLPELQTVLHTFIREMTAEELTGATGLYHLRKACLHRARKVMGEDAIDDVFITEIMVQ